MGTRQTDQARFLPYDPFLSYGPLRWTSRRCTRRGRVTPPMAPLRSRLQETENKNSTQTATFLRLAIVASLPIADRDTNLQVIRRLAAVFALRD